MDVALFALRKIYARLDNALTDRASKLSAQEVNFGEMSEDFQYALIIDAWAFVDMAHRLRQCLSAMPGLRLAPEISRFKTQLAEMENFRHHFQHLQQLQHSSKYESVWGGVIWRYKFTMTGMPSPIREGFALSLPAHSRISMVKMREEPVYGPSGEVANLTLSLINEKPINLTRIAMSLVSIEPLIVDCLSKLRA